MNTRVEDSNFYEIDKKVWLYVPVWFTDFSELRTWDDQKSVKMTEI